MGTIVIAPANPVLTVDKNGTITATQFTATVNGIAVPVAWSVERGEVGTIGLNDGRFTPRGSIGGTTRIVASAGTRTATTNVTVQVTWSQNGGTTSGASDAGADAGDAGAGNGAGGAGGVGGEGSGGNVDAATRNVLDGTPVADTGSKMLYPYAGTVWPRGLLAPLLQWQPGTHAYDAVRIKITQQNFSYTGYFAKTATAFVHHPVPQDVWNAFTRSNGGDDVTIELRFASGGVAYGSLTQTWKIAPSELKGIVYYNSYGTKLVQNYGGARGGGRFGAATLGINPGATDPTLIAGDDRDTEGCRVCHSVAANGSALITQRREAGEKKFSAYDLKTRVETTLSPEGQGIYSWPAIYPDGSMFLSDSSSLAGSSSAPSKLYTLPMGMSPQTPANIPVTGLPNNFRAACPSFAPDGKSLAFNYYAGTPAADAGAGPDGGALPAGDGRSLAMLQFDKASNAFDQLRVLYTPPVVGAAGREGVGVVWPSFLPTSNGVVFEVNIRSNGRDWGATRSECDNAGACNGIGARSELWWLDTATSTPHVLANLNGAGYLPSGANAHDDDATLNYEPTVNPVTSGGYAWVVFTSRRMYGNVATINPFYSDPRFADLHTDVTPKKLWVAAVDLNAPPGTDPSHPAFYLPGQELLAGNSRGYWVVDPCRSEGSGCETGDQCCGGYCRPSNGGAGALVCTSQVPTCAQEFERCTGDGDCCGTSLKCVANRCSNLTGPR